MNGGSKPNILLITADQWRGDCLGIAGHPLVTTPHLDALAGEGVYFSQHYAGAAPCSPARACLYTGLYQMNNRVCVNGTPLDRRHDTFALALRRQGYDPVLFGYTDQGLDPRRAHLNDPRLTSYEGVLPGFTPRLVVPEHEGPWMSWLANTTGVTIDGQAWPQLHYPQGGPVDPPGPTPPVYDAEHTQTAFVVGQCMEWLKENSVINNGDAKPWCAHVSLLRPHPPFVVPEPWNTRYSPDAVADMMGEQSWRRSAAVHPFVHHMLENTHKSSFIPGISGLARDWDAVARRCIAAIYLGMVSEVDDQLGRLFQALKSMHQWDNTLIVFTSDHGEMLGEHHLYGKLGFYEGSYHVPLIIKPARSSLQLASLQPHTESEVDTALSGGTKPMTAHRADGFSESVDVFPTVLDLTGGELPAQLDGVSLRPWFEGNGSPSVWRDAAHWEYDFRNIETRAAETRFNLSSQQCNLSVIRTAHYKYVHFNGQAPLLFNLADDPQEHINEADNPAYRSIRLTLAEQLLNWRATHLDQSLALSALTDNGVIGSTAKIRYE